MNVGDIRGWSCQALEDESKPGEGPQSSCKMMQTREVFQPQSLVIASGPEPQFLVIREF